MPRLLRRRVGILLCGSALLLLVGCAAVDSDPAEDTAQEGGHAAEDAPPAIEACTGNEPAVLLGEVSGSAEPANASEWEILVTECADEVVCVNVTSAAGEQAPGIEVCAPAPQLQHEHPFGHISAHHHNWERAADGQDDAWETVATVDGFAGWGVDHVRIELDSETVKADILQFREASMDYELGYYLVVLPQDAGDIERIAAVGEDGAEVFEVDMGADEDLELQAPDE